MSDDDKKRDAQEATAAMTALLSSLSDPQWRLLFRMVRPIVLHTTPEQVEYFMAPLTIDQRHHFMGMWQTLTESERFRGLDLDEVITSSGGVA